MQHVGSLIFIAPWVFPCSAWGLAPWPEFEPEPGCIGRAALSHWTTQEVSEHPSFNVCITFHPCVFSPVDGHLDCFQFWNITTRAVVNPCIYLLVWDGFLVDGFSGVPDDVWARQNAGQWGGQKVSMSTKGKVDLDRRRASPRWKNTEKASSWESISAYFLWPPCLKASDPGHSCSALGPQAKQDLPETAVTRGDVQWLFSRGFW